MLGIGDNAQTVCGSLYLLLESRAMGMEGVCAGNVWVLMGGEEVKVVRGHFLCQGRNAKIRGT